MLTLWHPANFVIQRIPKPKIMYRVAHQVSIPRSAASIPRLDCARTGDAANCYSSVRDEVQWGVACIVRIGIYRPQVPTIHSLKSQLSCDNQV